MTRPNSISADNAAVIKKLSQHFGLGHLENAGYFHHVNVFKGAAYQASFTIGISVCSTFSWLPTDANEDISLKEVVDEGTRTNF